MTKNSCKQVFKHVHLNGAEPGEVQIAFEQFFFRLYDLKFSAGISIVVDVANLLLPRPAPGLWIPSNSIPYLDFVVRRNAYMIQCSLLMEKKQD